MMCVCVGGGREGVFKIDDVNCYLGRVMENILRTYMGESSNFKNHELPNLQP